MFVLKYLGSIVNVQEPSTITITPTGVEVTPLETKVLKQMLSREQVSTLDRVGDALEVAGLLDRPKRQGAKINPNSVRQRVFAAVGECLAEHGRTPKSVVLAYVAEKHPDLSASQIAGNAQAYKCRREWGAWSPIE